MNAVRPRGEGDIQSSVYEDFRAAHGEYRSGEFELLARRQIFLADLNPVDAIADRAGNGVEQRRDLAPIGDVVADHSG